MRMFYEQACFGIKLSSAVNWHIFKTITYILKIVKILSGCNYVYFDFLNR